MVTSDWTAGQHAYNRYHYGGQMPASSSITTRDLVLDLLTFTIAREDVLPI